MNWLRSTLTDETGSFDVAYLSLFGVGTATIGAIPFMCLMAFLSWLRCRPTATMQCTFDPQPLGLACGAAAGGFATAIAALGVYMAATRKPAAPSPVQVTNAGAVINQPGT